MVISVAGELVEPLSGKGPTVSGEGTGGLLVHRFAQTSISREHLALCTGANRARASRQTVMSVRAMTDAVRGESISSAISPKHSPACNTICEPSATFRTHHDTSLTRLDHIESVAQLYRLDGPGPGP